MRTAQVYSESGAAACRRCVRQVGVRGIQVRMADIDPMASIEHELQSERASALAEAGRKLETMLAAFQALETEETLDELANAVWGYLIVREALAMFDHKAALAIYGVPPRVMARVGVIKREPALAK